MSADAIGPILKYWFETLKPRDWFRRDEMIDNKITARFAHIYEQLKSGVPGSWLASPEGYLAAILVLDQFPRNMFRDNRHAFLTDPAALALARDAIAKGYDMKLPPEQRAFLYMPFQHAEDLDDQARSIELFTKLGNPLNLDFALRHQAIIERFGRFPHRNELLGRKSTPEELAFLQEPGSSF
jgi:uncharacterized protein (DUF924 family)